MSNKPTPDFWDLVRDDPELAHARRKLSMHEFRLIMRHARASHHSGVLAALRAINADPYGCVFCDSGKLRNPAKPHEDDCGFALAEACLAL